MADIRTLLNEGTSAQQVASEYGCDSLYREIEEMCGDDMANVALRAAMQIGNRRLIRLASRIVLCGGYSAEVKKIAAENNQDLDLGEIRKKILRR